MGFFNNFARSIDKAVTYYITGEILLIAMLFLILNTFFIFIILHIFSKDFTAKEKLRFINKKMKISGLSPETEKTVNKVFKTMPYRFSENCNNIGSLKFCECVPHYESSKKKGNIFFAVFNLVVCMISFFMGLILSNGGLINISDAILIFILGAIFSLILYSFYIYLKQKTHKKLELSFDEFLKFIGKNKKSESGNLSQDSVENKPFKEVNKPEFIKSENLLNLSERVKEVKFKGGSTDKIKDLINELANERSKVTDSEEKEYLTDALTDLLNMINKTA